mmetsp:Transcript_3204/g.11138  ORF Transcript_3204/g.11138 Transcript_3204/m.11138 type:complete len:285 (+) Transcript_3204:423-1277(+)
MAHRVHKLHHLLRVHVQVLRLVVVVWHHIDGLRAAHLVHAVLRIHTLGARRHVKLDVSTNGPVGGDVAACGGPDLSGLWLQLQKLEVELEKELSGLLFAHIMHTGVKQEDAMLAATESALVGVKRTRWVPLVLKLAVAGERRHGGLAVDVARRLVETPLGRARTLQELRVSVSGPPVRRLGVDQVDQGNQLRTVERKCSRQGNRQGMARRNKGVLGLTASGLSTTWAKGAGRRCEVPLSSAPLPPPKLAARLLPLRETSRERALMSSMKVLIVGTCVALSSYPP